MIFLGQLRDTVHNTPSHPIQTQAYREAELRKTRRLSSAVTLLKSWTDPYLESLELIRIATAKTVPRDIVADFVIVNEIGKGNYSSV